MMPERPPEYFNFAEDVLGAQAHDDPMGLAILAVDEQGIETRWSFREVNERSSQFAHLLRAASIGRGDITLVMLADVPMGVVARLGVMKAGGVSLLVRHGATPREMAHYLDRAKPRLAVVGPDDVNCLPPDLPRIVAHGAAFADVLAAQPALFPSQRMRQDEPEHIVLTGGTTGLPKLVVHTHGSRAFHYLRWTVAFAPGDLSWDMTGRWWLGAWRHGTPVFHRAMPGAATAELVFQTLRRYPVTCMMGPARLYGEMLRQGIGGGSLGPLRLCCSAGQALDPALGRAWTQATGLTIYDRYGQSECAESPFEPLESGMAAAGSLGRPFPWVEMAIIDEAGTPLPPGTLGEIAIKCGPTRPPWLFREYLGDPIATAARHRDNWYLTGDVGRMDARGFVFMAGRADDVINCGGTNIGPWEIESVLLEHPAVREAAVVGLAHADLGQVPRAYVVVESGMETTAALGDELMRFVAGAIHPHKRLWMVTFCETLPKTPAGKVRRGELRD
jgi:acetyl-CoA synthetase